VDCINYKLYYTQKRHNNQRKSLKTEHDINIQNTEKGRIKSHAKNKYKSYLINI
jgi:hypothetical protein